MDFKGFWPDARRDEGATTICKANNAFWETDSWRAWEANPQRSVTKEQRSSRAKDPKDTALDL
jgi:hypothetical protein